MAIKLVCTCDEGCCGIEFCGGCTATGESCEYAEPVEVSDET